MYLQTLTKLLELRFFASDMINTLSDLDKLIQLRTALVAIESVEETRVLHHLTELAKSRNTCLYTWDAANGLVCVTHIVRLPTCGTLKEALAYVKTDIAEGLVLVLDPQPHLKDPAVERQLKEIGGVIGFELDQQIHITAGAIFPLRRRAEHLHAAHTIAPTNVGNLGMLLRRDLHMQ